MSETYEQTVARIMQERNCKRKSAVQFLRRAKKAETRPPAVTKKPTKKAAPKAKKAASVRVRRTPLDSEKIISHFKAGMTITGIAEILGTKSKKPIRAILREAGLK